MQNKGYWYCLQCIQQGSDPHQDPSKEMSTLIDSTRDEQRYDPTMHWPWPKEGAKLIPEEEGILNKKQSKKTQKK